MAGSPMGTPVFRVAVLGMAESGKTCFCAQVVTHCPVASYDHTDDVKNYRRDVATANFVQAEEEAPAPGKKGGEKKKPKKAAKGPERYGLVISDVPGEVSSLVCSFHAQPRSPALPRGPPPLRAGGVHRCCSAPSKRFRVRSQQSDPDD